MKSEAELIKGCLKGKRRAQHAFYKQFAGKMMAVCMRYARDRAEAEDILQDGFVKIFTKLDQYNHKGALEGWVRRIIVNTALEHLRKQRLDFSDDEYAYLSYSSDDFNIDKQLNADDLMAMVQNLSPGYRVVFNLYAIEGFSHKEIAEKLNISAGTSKSQLARARKILQDKLTNNSNPDNNERLVETTQVGQYV